MSSAMHPFLQKLQGGDRRSIGRSEQVVADVLENPLLFNVVFEGILCDDPIISMRCADATEKISARHPEYLYPYKIRLLSQAAKIEQQEVRWHVAQMIPRLALDQGERERAVEILLVYLGDESKVVKVSAMQALADLVAQDASLLPRVVPLLRQCTQSGSPAMQSRGRKLLAGLQAVEKWSR
jgi:hypothetical protein